MLAFYVFGNSPVAVGEVGCCLVLTGLGLYASFRYVSHVVGFMLDPS